MAEALVPATVDTISPKVWGRKYAATKLVQTIMDDKRKQIEDAERELIKLQRCLDKVNLWSDTDL